MATDRCRTAPSATGRARARADRPAPSHRHRPALLDGGAFFEAPRWRDGRWWVSDFYRHVVMAVTPAGEAEEVMTVEGQPSGLGWMPDGSLLVVSMLDRRLLRRWPDGTVTEHADLGPHGADKANDMVVDASGRAYVGNFGFDLEAMADPAPTTLMRVDPDGTVSVAAEDLWLPNGTVITPDGATLIVNETTAARLTAFTVAEDGSLSDRRIFAQLAPTPEPGSFAEMVPQLRVAPDGRCLDADGHVWVADALGGDCLRVAPGGEVVERIPPPDGVQTIACMLGGDGRTLLTCVAPDFSARMRAVHREAVLLSTQVDVPHAGLP
jgi:sugar lactone lactonase YvrE